MIKRPFEQWLYEEVELTFGIDRVHEHKALKDWLNVSPAKPLSERVEKLRLELTQNIENWNEDELKMMFIALLLAEIGFNNLPHYKVFTQRMFTLQTPEVEASGRVEWFVATGKQIPRNPFFFLQEFKPEKNGGNDPLGQLLIAMVDAQIMNNNPQQCLYGCYNIGRIWFFVVLIGKEYGVSRAYDATQTDDLTDMVAILKKVKAHIHQELNLPPPED
ncbi:MAG: hypothetical protein MUE85_10740 [Microscillaceae bacterium]|jgi:hypothetical protein|nr:hypothetical protein [Microscillaceae bacterium]